VCQGSSQTYSITAVTGATSYTWTLATGWTGTSTTNSITVTTGATSGNVSVTATNACGTSSAGSLAVTVSSSVPAQPGTITGSTAVCQGSSQTYSIAAVTGASSYIWTLPSGWAGTSTTTSITATSGSGTGNISVNANNVCGLSQARILAVTANLKPATPVINQNVNELISDALLGNQWYSSLGSLVGATGQTYKPLESGNYYVIVALNGCSSDPSNVISFIPTGMDKQNEFKSLKIYPNPVGDELTIEYPGNNKDIDFSILNSSGQTVFKGKVAEKASVNTSGLSSGVYMIRFSSGVRSELRKVVRR
jgi:hypothetical protein